MSPSHTLLPQPVLFNAWKHHAGWVRERVAATSGPGGLDALAAELVVVGNRVMDFYTGPLPPDVLADRVLAILRATGRFAPDPFRDWLAADGYAVVEVPDDGSKWALRLGPADGRYVHLHPGRYSPNTVRIHANALKTAALAHAAATGSGDPPTDVALVNAVRKRYLGLPPVPTLGAGLAEAIVLLGPVV